MASHVSPIAASKSRRSQAGGYLPIEDYGMIGNMYTCALVGIDGSIDFMCWHVASPNYNMNGTHLANKQYRPDFDSPSVFCRLLDKNKGGYFSISPSEDTVFTTKQQYLPSSCVLQTRYIHDGGVVDLIDFFPRPKSTQVTKKGTYDRADNVEEEMKKWLVRRVECVRGSMTLGMVNRKLCEHADGLTKLFFY